MGWLQRNGWWTLMAIALLTVVRGVVDVTGGVTFQAEDMFGATIADIEAVSANGAGLANFAVRTGGLYLIAYGLLTGAVLVFAYRQGHAWAWWAMWTIPAIALASSGLDVAASTVGVPGPAISGAVVGGLAAAILLISAPRFFGTRGSVTA